MYKKISDWDDAMAEIDLWLAPSHEEKCFMILSIKIFSQLRVASLVQMHLRLRHLLGRNINHATYQSLHLFENSKRYVREDI